jgi:hypothetical protein
MARWALLLVSGLAGCSLLFPRHLEGQGPGETDLSQAADLAADPPDLADPADLAPFPIGLDMGAIDLLVPGCSNPGDCNDSNPCTDDQCVGGMCLRTPNTSPCPDTNPCTVNETCSSGFCLAVAKSCPANQTCEASSGNCVCPADKPVRCNETCYPECCPGTSGGSCPYCGTLFCESNGRFNCINKGPCQPGEACFNCGSCGAVNVFCMPDCRWPACVTM